MPAGTYEIHAKADSLDVCWRGPASYRVFGGVMVTVCLAEIYLASFGRGRSPGVWATLLRSSPGTAGFISNAFESGLILIFTAFFLALGIRHLLPFRETLHCDRTALTWSRIPWLSLGNRWVTRSTPLPEICGAHYGIVYKSKNVHGVVLETYGDNWKLFWGIEPPEANRILHGLKALGVNVHHDPEMRESIRETLRDRRAQL
jgi:hypothetical protein